MIMPDGVGSMESTLLFYISFSLLGTLSSGQGDAEDGRRKIRGKTMILQMEEREDLWEKGLRQRHARSLSQARDRERAWD